MKTTQDNLRGTRHLRVGVEIGAGPAKVTSIWVVDEAVVQHSALTQPIVAQVEVAGKAAVVQSFADPRVARGSFRDKEGHYFHRTESGVIEVSVPFDSAIETSSVRIRLADLAEVGPLSHTPDELTAMFRVHPKGMREIGTLSAGDLERHKDWEGVARHLGFPLEPGRFEIYRDNSGEFRWRLRRRDGVIAADGARGYASRQDCEEDLRWVRQNAANAPIVGLDLDEGPSAGEP